MTWVNVETAAQFYKVKEKTIRAWAKSGRLESQGKGRMLLISLPTDDGARAPESRSQEIPPTPPDDESECQNEIDREVILQDAAVNASDRETNERKQAELRGIAGEITEVKKAIETAQKDITSKYKELGKREGKMLDWRAEQKAQIDAERQELAEEKQSFYADRYEKDANVLKSRAQDAENEESKTTGIPPILKVIFVVVVVVLAGVVILYWTGNGSPVDRLLKIIFGGG